MTSSVYERNPPIDLVTMPEARVIAHSDLPATTATTSIEDSDRTVDDKHRSSDSIASPIHQKQKSLISVYDNHLQQQSTSSTHPLVGIIGRNRRSEAFRNRLIRSGFPNPILCDIKSTLEFDSDPADSSYISYELFYGLSPTIILITDDLAASFEDLFPHTKQQLVVDTRVLVPKYFSRASRPPSRLIPGSHRAFGNLSDWEIEYGTQRTRVAIEQNPSPHLIGFIYDLNCSTRGIDTVDFESYSNYTRRLFPTCLFPLISTVVIFTFCWIVSMVEYADQTGALYRQASSITAATSIILLALLYALKPVLDIIDLSYASIFKSHNPHKPARLDLGLVQRCLHSQRYLAWYSLSFALLHLTFLPFCQRDLNARFIACAFILGVISLILLYILACAHLPWASDRILWVEYHFLTSYVGLFCLLLASAHLIILHAKANVSSFSLKTFALVLALTVLILRLVVYGMIYPIRAFVQQARRPLVQTGFVPTKTTSVFV